MSKKLKFKKIVKKNVVLLVIIFFLLTLLSVFLENIKKTQDAGVGSAASLPGDCDGINGVNIVDYQLLSLTFGKSLGDTGYDGRCNFIDTDNTINVLDFQVLSNNFGKTGPTPTGTSGYLINETFSSTASNFSSVSGTWGVVNGRYEVTSPSIVSTSHLNNRSIHNTVVSGDFVLTANARSISLNNYDDFAIIFGWQDSSNYYFASFNEQNDSGTSGIFKVVNGTPTQIADITTLISAGTNYSIKIERIGSLINVYLNGNLVSGTNDSTYQSGKVGFGTKDNKASFDDLLVQGAQGVTLTPSPTGSATKTPTPTKNPTPTPTSSGPTPTSPPSTGVSCSSLSGIERKFPCSPLVVGPMPESTSSSGTNSWAMFTNTSYPGVSGNGINERFSAVPNPNGSGAVVKNQNVLSDSDGHTTVGTGRSLPKGTTECSAFRWLWKNETEFQQKTRVLVWQLQMQGSPIVAVATSESNDTWFFRTRNGSDGGLVINLGNILWGRWAYFTVCTHLADAPNGWTKIWFKHDGWPDVNAAPFYQRSGHNTWQGETGHNTLGIYAGPDGSPTSYYGYFDRYGRASTPARAIQIAGNP